jgi:WD40 repeat protein
VSTLSGHSSWVLSVAFSSDNQHLISSYVFFCKGRILNWKFLLLVHRINRLKFGIQKQNDVFIHLLNIPIKYGVLDLIIRVHNLYQCHKTKVL